MSKKRWGTLTVSITLAVVWLVLLRPLFLGGPASYIVVSGVSMEPTMHTGDVVVVHRHDEYEVGDVIAYRIDDDDVVIHRIVGGNATDGFVTQGDNRQHVDGWHPRPEEILGSRWLHIPGAGDRLLWLTNPGNIGFVLAAIAALPLLGAVEVEPHRSRAGRRRRSMHARQEPGMASAGNLWGAWPGSTNLLIGFVAAAALGIASLAVGAMAFLSTPERTEYVEQLAYEHHSTFDYTVEMERSTLYPGGQLTPVVAEDGTASPAQPVFTQLAREMVIDYTYALDSTLPPVVTGRLSADLVIRAGDGWTRTEPLIAPRTFEGSGTTQQFTIDLAAIQALITRIEEETGFTPRTYTLSVQPRIEITGNLGAHAIEETYAPVYEIQYDATRITPATTLASSEPQSVGRDAQIANEMRFLGLTRTVGEWRWAGIIGATLGLSAAIAIAAVALLGVGQPEEQRILARYRRMLVPVETTGASASGASIQVATMKDLARLAQRDGGIIFHESRPFMHRYFVRDGEVTYDYTVRPVGSARAESGSRAADQSAPARN